MEPPFTLYSKPEYLQDITERIADTAPGDRIALATMSFEPEYPEIQHLLDELGKAALRGVEATLLVDAYIFLIGDHQLLGPLFYHSRLPEMLGGEFGFKYQTLERLREQGVSCAITNQPKRAFSLPVGGRSHIKFGIINDRVYLGGCNLDHPENIDLMAGWDDPQFATFLRGFSRDMFSHQGTSFMEGRDLQLATGHGDTVYIDSGIPKQSLILKQALEMIDKAEDRIFFASQFFPNANTARRIAQAWKPSQTQGRGVEVTIYYNHPDKFGKPRNVLQHLNVAFEGLRMPGELFANQVGLDKPYLHAKVLATEKGVMLGSHNYIAAGVNFGTAEIALYVDDPVFSKAVCDKLTSLIER